MGKNDIDIYVGIVQKLPTPGLRQSVRDQVPEYFGPFASEQLAQSWFVQATTSGWTEPRSFTVASMAMPYADLKPDSEAVAAFKRRKGLS